MGCGITMIKYLLFLANFVCALAGLAILGLGTFGYIKIQDLMDEYSNPKAYVIAFIVIGAIVFTISFFGCCGAIRESHCMIITYFCILLVLIILQVIIGVMLFVYLPELRDAVEKFIRQLFSRPDESSRDVFHSIETFINCCGASGPGDYTGQTTPKSCCPISSEGFCHPSDIYQKGCMSAARDLTEKYGKTGGIVMFIVAGVEAIVGIFSLCLANSIRNAERRSRY